MEGLKKVPRAPSLWTTVVARVPLPAGLVVQVVTCRCRDLMCVTVSAQKNDLCHGFPFTTQHVVEGFAMLKSRRAVGKIVFDLTAGVEDHLLRTGRPLCRGGRGRGRRQAHEA